MEMEVWLEWYGKILDDFGFSRKADEESASYLESFLREHGCPGPESLTVPSPDFIVFGAGPSLRKHVKRFKEVRGNVTIVAADGATTALLEEGLIPHIIVTDLDGRMEDIIEANRRGPPWWFMPTATTLRRSEVSAMPQEPYRDNPECPLWMHIQFWGLHGW